MHFKALTSALVVSLVGASPLAAPEFENATSLDTRAVLSTKLYAIYNTVKWETNVARKFCTF